MNLKSAWRGTVSSFKSGMSHRPSVLGLHLSLLLIVAGALVTHFGSRTTVLTLYEGQTDTTLPLPVTLRSFEVVTYPGTSTPAGFECTIEAGEGRDLTAATLSMNHVLRKSGYRFLLSGYDEGGGVSVTAIRDPWGTGLVFAGYIILLLSMVFFLFFEKNSNFRKALGRVSKAAAVVVVLLVCGTSPLRAAQSGPKVLPREVADEFGQLYVYYSGRIAPMQTMARDYVMKAYGKPGYKGYTAEQVFTGWMLFYDSWKDVPLKKKNITEREQAVMAVAAGKAVKMFPVTSPEDGSVQWYASGDRLPWYVDDDEWTFIRKVGMLVGEYAFEKDYGAVSDVISKVAKYQTDRIGESLPPPSKLRAERTYNAVGRPFVPAIVLVMLGIILFVLSSLKIRWTDRIARACGVLGLVYLSIVLALRWYVSGHIPLATGFELMEAIAWAACLFVTVSGKGFSTFRPMGVLLAGFAMMVANLGISNPQIGHLQPVLSSPLLSVHVSCMMFAYTLFALLALCGVMGLISRNPQTRRDYADRGLTVLYPALFLMVAGTIVGSYWASVSWGSYWSWDPKETWSLITILVYSLALHPQYFPLHKKPERFLVFSIIAFGSVLFTYFGVNLLLGGLHSYAG